MKKIDDEIFEKMYLAGASRREMADFFGVAPSSISDRIVQYNLRNGQRYKDTYIDKGMIKALYESGNWTPSDISYETKTSEETVRAVLADYARKGQLRIRRVAHHDPRDTNHVWTV